MDHKVANQSLNGSYGQRNPMLGGHRAFDPHTLRCDISHASSCAYAIRTCGHSVVQKDQKPA